jgi:hypothetical protein
MSNEDRRTAAVEALAEAIAKGQGHLAASSADIYDAGFLLAALAPGWALISPDETADALGQAMRDHILDRRPGKGWPHMRGSVMPGDGPQLIDGCDDNCADDIAARLAAPTPDAQETKP